jgi:uncharacterized protein YcfJ
MNKSMLTGIVAGVAIATAGGVAGYAFLAEPSEAPGSAVVIDEPAAVPTGAETAVPAPAPAVAAAPAPAQPVARAPAPAPARTAAPRPQPVATPAAAPVVQEECWDEEVTVQADPKDDRAIAGTATGAILGGALAKKLGDDNDLLTAAGAAAGAFAGRRVQREIQENNTTTTIERRCAPVGSR